MKSQALLVLLVVSLSVAACGAASPAPTPTTPNNTATAIPVATTVPAVPRDNAATSAATVPTSPVTPTIQTAPVSAAHAGTVTLKIVADNLEPLTYLTYANDNPARMYLVAKAGRVLVLEGGVVNPQPFLDISDRVSSKESERGLLSIAFSPHYATDRAFYAYYTGLDGGVVVSRFKASSEFVHADAASEQVLLTFAKSYANHNGGQLQFGPDGMLYIGTGDGGSQGDPNGNGQNKQVLLGKLLRIDVSQPGQTYTTPAGNPLAGKGGIPEIWAYGLRNPWRFSFDRKTGDLYIADVGQDKYEEIDFQPAGDPGGENYGWNLYEGFEPYKGNDASGLTMPVFAYDHQLGCAIVGGYVYRGANLPALSGVYLYSDYCTGHLWSLQRSADGHWVSQLLAETGESVSSFGEDAAGEVYVIALRGAVYQLMP